MANEAMSPEQAGQVDMDYHEHRHLLEEYCTRTGAAGLIFIGIRSDGHISTGDFLDEEADERTSLLFDFTRQTLSDALRAGFGAPLHTFKGDRR